MMQPPVVAVPAPVFTLGDALAQAQRVSPSAEAASAAVRAAAAARRGAALPPNPTVSAEIENVGGSARYNAIEAPKQTFSVAYPLELGGKRVARIGVADAQAARAELDQTVSGLDLQLKVTQAYADVLAAERRLTNAKEQSRLADEGLQAAQVRVAAGRASPLEESRASVVVTNAQVALERAARQVRITRQSLGLRLGRTVPVRLDEGWFDRIAAPPPADPAVTVAVAAARADIAAATAATRLARAEATPDISVSAGVRRVDGADGVAGVIGLSVPLPLFNRGTAAIARARAERDRAVALAQAAEVDAADQVQKTAAERDDAAAAARAAVGPVLTDAQEAARIARIGYREGKFGQLDLIEAERALAQTRDAAVDALATYHDAQARLERLTTPYDGARP